MSVDVINIQTFTILSVKMVMGGVEVLIAAILLYVLAVPFLSSTDTHTLLGLVSVIVHLSIIPANTIPGSSPHALPN